MGECVRFDDNKCGCGELLRTLARAVEELLPGLDPAWAKANKKAVGCAESAVAHVKVHVGDAKPDPMAKATAAEPAFQRGLKQLLGKPEPAAPPTMRFGKHKDKPIAQVADEDPGYLRWVLQQDWCKDKLREQIGAALI
jgi:hypothetical protein